MIFYLMRLKIIFLGIIFPVKILFNIILETGVCMGEVGNGFTLHALLLEFIHSRKSDFSDCDLHSWFKGDDKSIYKVWS